MDPSIWPITAAALIERPTSWAIQISGTRTMPVAGSTSTRATPALYEQAGEGPTLAPRYFPAPAAGVHEPTVPTVPAATTAMSEGSRPSTSATMIASTESEPWPISVDPQNTVTPPPRSHLSCTPECGIAFQ